MTNETKAEWPERITLRDTRVVADEGQRILTTATGHGYEKQEYVIASVFDAHHNRTCRRISWKEGEIIHDAYGTSAGIESIQQKFIKADKADDYRSKLFPYADATEITGMSWGGFNIIGDKKSIAEVQGALNKAYQIEQYKAAFLTETEALKLKLEKANDQNKLLNEKLASERRTRALANQRADAAQAKLTAIFKLITNP